MTSSLLQKARANRIAALNSLRLRDEPNIFSLDDARRRRANSAPVAVMFTSRRAA